MSGTSKHEYEFHEGDYVFDIACLIIGKIDRLVPGYAFVFYENNNVSEEVPLSLLLPIYNSYIIGETSLGGAMT